MSTVTAIVTCCNRLHNVERIWRALRSQTAPCREIWFYYNGKESLRRGDLPPFDHCVFSDDGENYYARYALGLAARGSHVLIVDDDCVPEQRWLEVCLETERKHGGIVASSGFRVRNRDFATGSYRSIRELGRESFSDSRPAVKEVDIPFHSYFLRREVLVHMFRHPISVGLEGGEVVPIVGGDDIALACRAWVEARLRCWVPGHPEEGMRGEGEETADEEGASWVRRAGFQEDRVRALRYEASLGWKPLKLRAPWRRHRSGGRPRPSS